MKMNVETVNSKNMAAGFKMNKQSVTRLALRVCFHELWHCKAAKTGGGPSPGYEVMSVSFWLP